MHPWPDCPTEDLIAFVKSAKRLKPWGAKEIRHKEKEHPLMRLWVEHAASVIGESEKWTLWGTILDSKAPKDDSGEWVQGLRPYGKGAHIHGWNNAPCLIHYLQAAEGGELAIVRDGEMIEISPSSGEGYVVMGKEPHGVRPVKSGERIALIAAGI